MIIVVVVVIRIAIVVFVHVINIAVVVIVIIVLAKAIVDLTRGVVHIFVHDCIWRRFYHGRQSGRGNGGQRSCCCRDFANG